MFQSRDRQYIHVRGKDKVCHHQIFGHEALSDLTAKSNAIEVKRGFQVLYETYSRTSVMP
jgi:hypothetical protein